MTQIADAPWVRDAELNGVGYHEQTEEEYRSETYRESVVEGLKKARNLIQMAVGILEGLPEDTVWDDEIAEAADTAADFGFTLENLTEQVERW
jgi:hypothetical protein